MKPLGVLRIAIFGSYARGESRTDSDIDILVTLPAIRNRKPIGLRWFSLTDELREKLGVSVDLVTEASLSSSLREIVERDLEIIYEKAG